MVQTIPELIASQACLFKYPIVLGTKNRHQAGKCALINLVVNLAFKFDDPEHLLL